MKYVAKIKGRGYYAGFTASFTHKFKTDEQLVKEGYTKQSNPVSYYDRFNYVYTAKTVFKRNLSDVPPELIYDSREAFESEYKLECERLTGKATANWKQPDLIQTKFPENVKFEMVEYEAGNLGKRVVNSKKLWEVRNGVNLHLPAKTTTFCGACGTNIYPDEKLVTFGNNTSVCIHCIHSFAQDVIAEYEKTPEEYKTEYLLARSVDF